jgi:hypothetical protein
MSKYAEASRLYRELGWPQVTPAKEYPESKKPAEGVSGVFGRNPMASKEQMDGWEQRFPERNCLLRMPVGFIGVDIDEYWKAGAPKRGYQNILQDFVRFGDLPATYSSTSRGSGQPSRILFYKVRGGVRFNSAPYKDVEIIQHHHRYAVVWPSVHPGTGETYYWYDKDGQECAPPKACDISSLPDEWYAPLMTSTKVFGARTRRTGLSGLTAPQSPYPGTADDWILSLDDSELSWSMSLFLSEFLQRPSAHVGHDELLRLVGKLHWLQFSRGERGARKVFEAIAQTFLLHTNEQEPYRELFDIVRYVAGEDFSPCRIQN